MIEITNGEERVNVLWRPIGSIDINRAIELRCLADVATTSPANLIIDLSRTDFIDYAGIQLAVNAMRHIRALGGTAFFVNPDGHVLRVLQFVGLYPVAVGNDHDEPSETVASRKTRSRRSPARHCGATRERTRVPSRQATTMSSTMRSSRRPDRFA